MASTMIPPFIVRLPSVANAGSFQNNPTLEAGDVTIRTDVSARANIQTLPTVDGYDVIVSIDDTELPLGWNTVSVDFNDVAGNQWKPVHVALFSDLFSIADPLMKQVPGDYPTGTAGAMLGKLSTGRVTVAYPLSEKNVLTLKYGDSYHAVDGRAIDFSSDGWPSLAGATVTFKYGNVSLPMSVVSVADTQVVRLELSKAQVEAITRVSIPFEVDATLFSGHEVTLVEGRVVVL